MKSKIRLGVNIDHVATLRQVRGDSTPYPDLYKAAELVVAAGAEQITIHLREDRRHIQDKDVIQLCKKRPALINLEMAATEEMKNIAIRNRPDWVCLVPEKRRELTTEGGLDVIRNEKKLKKLCAALKEKGILVSLFVAGNEEQIRASHRVGADAVELHTGHWVLYKGQKKTKEWKALRASALLAHQLGMRVHAGHGLDTKSLKPLLKLPHLQEVNIGHSIVCQALFVGLKQAVKEIKLGLKP